MDSFELNKILGAVLGTCLLLLVTSFAAGAIFAPADAGKAGLRDRRQGSSALAAARKPRRRRPSRSRSCCRPPPSRRAPPRPRSARPATPSRRAARTASVRTSTASSTSRRAKARGFNFSAAMKAKGGTWTYRRPQQVPRQSQGLRSGHRDGLRRHPEGQRARRRDRLSAHACRTIRLRCRRRRSNIPQACHGLPITAAARHCLAVLHVTPSGRLRSVGLLSGRFAAPAPFTGLVS